MKKHRSAKIRRFFLHRLPAVPKPSIQLVCISEDRARVAAETAHRQAVLRKPSLDGARTASKIVRDRPQGP